MASVGNQPQAAVFQRVDLAQHAEYTTAKCNTRGRLWLFVSIVLFRWSWFRAFGWRRWLLRRFGASMPDASWVYRTVRIEKPWLLKIGRFSTIAKDVELFNLDELSIGDHTVISQGAVVCGGTRDYTRQDLHIKAAPIRIGSGVWIAAHAFIGPGVTIGDNAIIGARAVVVHDVPPNSVAAGNPARPIKTRTMRQPAI